MENEEEDTARADREVIEGRRAQKDSNKGSNLAWLFVLGDRVNMLAKERRDEGVNRCVEDVSNFCVAILS